MSKNYAFTAEKRDRAGKGVARALRREDKIPAVIYGDKKDPVTIALPANDINLAYSRGGMFTTLCDLDIEGEKHVLLARDVQLHPVTDLVQHVDFLRVTAKTEITVSVPVHTINEEKSPGLHEKGVMNMVRFELELVCSAMNIPDFVEADLTGLEQGQSLHIDDVTLPEGTKSALDWNVTILNVTAPRKIELDVVEEVAVEGEDGEAAEGAEGEGGDASAEGGDDAKGNE